MAKTVTLSQLLKYVARFQGSIEEAVGLEPQVREMVVTPATTQEEFDRFMADAATTVIEANQGLDRFTSMYDALGKLRGIIADMNHEKGIDKLMTAQSLAAKKANWLRIHVVPAFSVAKGGSARTLAHYQSAFTETCKSDTVRVLGTDEALAERVKGLADQCKREAARISDEIARINQTTEIDLPDDLVTALGLDA